MAYIVVAPDGKILHDETFATEAQADAFAYGYEDGRGLDHCVDITVYELVIPDTFSLI